MGRRRGISGVFGWSTRKASVSQQTALLCHSYRRALRFEPLEDRRLLAVDLVSKSTITGFAANGSSSIGAGAICEDGRYIAFASNATDLVAGMAITPGTTNVYRMDRMTGEVVLVSVNAAGTGSGNGRSGYAVISADGNVVAFASEASNLTTLADTNGTFDMFARNMATGTTYLVSANAAGTGSGNSTIATLPVISADGSTVVFASYASDLHALDTNGNTADLFARNLVTGTTHLVSVNAAGTGSGDKESSRTASPTISADGSVVAFVSEASNLTTLIDTNNSWDVFARNLITGTTYLVSVNMDGTGSGNKSSSDVFIPAISADGTVVAFISFASDLHALDTNNAYDVFARNLVTQTTYLVSVNSDGTGSGNSGSGTAPLNSGPVISADGSVVAFTSSASNLHVLDTNNATDVFARNLVT